MSSPILHRLLPIAAALSLLGAVAPAAAFSQIGSEDGSNRQKTGIVSVPLPPLPGAVTETPRVETQPAVPATVAPPAADTPPNSAPPVSDPGTTDEGEVDTPSNDPALPADPAGSDVPAGDPGTTDDSTAPQTAPAGAAPPAASSGDAAPEASPDQGPEAADEPVPPAKIYYGEEGLPPAVRDLRQKLLEVARSGDVDALRPYLQGGEDATVLTFGGTEGDPIDLLKSASGDGEGVEMLAILLEILQAGHVRSEPDTDDEIFVWPYFTGVPIDKLTKPQKVELFELVTAGDYQEMLGFGAYNFYRVGISPDGKLQFFVAGD
jgi:hypothetical protein